VTYTIRGIAPLARLLVIAVAIAVEGFATPQFRAAGLGQTSFTAIGVISRSEMEGRTHGVPFIEVILARFSCRLAAYTIPSASAAVN
jgi:hypothetical protein